MLDDAAYTAIQSIAYCSVKCAGESHSSHYKRPTTTHSDATAVPSLVTAVPTQTRQSSHFTTCETDERPHGASHRVSCVMPFAVPSCHVHVVSLPLTVNVAIPVGVCGLLYKVSDFHTWFDTAVAPKRKRAFAPTHPHHVRRCTRVRCGLLAQFE